MRKQNPHNKGFSWQQQLAMLQEQNKQEAQDLKDIKENTSGRKENNSLLTENQLPSETQNNEPEVIEQYEFPESSRSYGKNIRQNFNRKEKRRVKNQISEHRKKAITNSVDQNNREVLSQNYIAPKVKKVQLRPEEIDKVSDIPIEVDLNEYSRELRKMHDYLGRRIYLGLLLNNSNKIVKSLDDKYDCLSQVEERYDTHHIYWNKDMPTQYIYSHMTYKEYYEELVDRNTSTLTKTALLGLKAIKAVDSAVEKQYIVEIHNIPLCNERKLGNIHVKYFSSYDKFSKFIKKKSYRKYEHNLIRIFDISKNTVEIIFQPDLKNVVSAINYMKLKDDHTNIVNLLHHYREDLKADPIGRGVYFGMLEHALNISSYQILNSYSKQEIDQVLGDRLDLIARRIELYMKQDRVYAAVKLFNRNFEYFSYATEDYSYLAPLILDLAVTNCHVHAIEDLEIANKEELIAAYFPNSIPRLLSLSRRYRHDDIRHLLQVSDSTNDSDIILSPEAPQRCYDVLHFFLPYYLDDFEKVDIEAIEEIIKNLLSTIVRAGRYDLYESCRYPHKERYLEEAMPYFIASINDVIEKDNADQLIRLLKTVHHDFWLQPTGLKALKHAAIYLHQAGRDDVIRRYINVYKDHIISDITESLSDEDMAEIENHSSTLALTTAKLGDELNFKTLVALNHQLDYTDAQNNTLLHYLLDEEAAEQEHGQDQDQGQDQEEEQILSSLAINLHMEVALSLFNLRKSKLEMANYLLSNGGQKYLRQVNKNQQNVIDYAIEKYEQQNRHGMRELHCNLELLKLYLENGAEPILGHTYNSFVFSTSLTIATSAGLRAVKDIFIGNHFLKSLIWNPIKHLVNLFEKFIVAAVANASVHDYFYFKVRTFLSEDYAKSVLVDATELCLIGSVHINWWGGVVYGQDLRDTLLRTSGYVNADKAIYTSKDLDLSFLHRTESEKIQLRNSLIFKYLQLKKQLNESKMFWTIEGLEYAIKDIERALAKLEDDIGARFSPEFHRRLEIIMRERTAKEICKEAMLDIHVNTFIHRLYQGVKAGYFSLPDYQIIKLFYIKQLLDKTQTVAELGDVRHIDDMLELARFTNSELHEYNDELMDLKHFYERRKQEIKAENYCFYVTNPDPDLAEILQSIMHSVSDKILDLFTKISQHEREEVADNMAEFITSAGCAVNTSLHLGIHSILNAKYFDSPLQI